MKKTVLSFIAMVGISLGINAQATNYPNGSTIPNFTVTDIHGETHDLYTIAASGKWILLDFFQAVNCTNCQNTAPVFSELYQKYGCNDGDLHCISLNFSYSFPSAQSNVIAFENTYSTSTGFLPSPAVAYANDLFSSFGVNQTATFVLIGSNKKMKNNYISQAYSVEVFESAMAAAGFYPDELNCATSLAIDEITTLNNNLSVYPNPAMNEATISMNLKDASKIDVQIVNLVGAEVSNQTFAGQQGENNLTLDVSALQSGQYLVKIMLENGTSKQSALNMTK